MAGLAAARAIAEAGNTPSGRTSDAGGEGVPLLPPGPEGLPPTVGRVAFAAADLATGFFGVATGRLFTAIAFTGAAFVGAAFVGAAFVGIAFGGAAFAGIAFAGVAGALRVGLEGAVARFTPEGAEEVFPAFAGFTFLLFRALVLRVVAMIPTSVASGLQRP